MTLRCCSCIKMSEWTWPRFLPDFANAFPDRVCFLGCALHISGHCLLKKFYFAPFEYANASPIVIHSHLVTNLLCVVLYRCVCLCVCICPCHPPRHPPKKSPRQVFWCCNICSYWGIKSLDGGFPSLLKHTHTRTHTTLSDPHRGIQSVWPRCCTCQVIIFIMNQMEKAQLITLETVKALSPQSKEPNAFTRHTYWHLSGAFDTTCCAYNKSTHPCSKCQVFVMKKKWDQEKSVFPPL